MRDAIVVFGLLLFWASLLWLPLCILRAVSNRARAQVWSISAILAFGMVFMGYTRAMMQGTAAEAFAWSISWAMPVGLALYARAAPDAVNRHQDIWVGAAVAISFMPILPFMPGVLRGVAAAIW